MTNTILIVEDDRGRFLLRDNLALRGILRRVRGRTQPVPWPAPPVAA